ncbi:acyl-CoA N-acyltransferase [Lentinula boryana]|uniref:Acyl-CoA N-acyltransferase n=1 Tax=Lentinula boryana TaxID=40481 RepID=A0ABQ8Q366_9AGAR|nr:acyl-CoA N-acyltransferase [Lentinula boryana]
MSSSSLPSPSLPPPHPSPSHTSQPQPSPSQPQPSLSLPDPPLPPPPPSSESQPSPITYRLYTGEPDLPHIISLIESELSEPYVVYTFRYFLSQWPHLSFLAYTPESPTPIGVIVCKQSFHESSTNSQGYIAMLSVDKRYRKRGIGVTLVKSSMEAMKLDGVEEITLETEHDNHPALSLYESLGFIREKRLYRFYLNGKDAFRLVLGVPASESELELELGEGEGEGEEGYGDGEGEGEGEEGSSESGREQDEMKMKIKSGMMRRYSRKRPGALGPRRYRAIVVDGYDEDEEGEEGGGYQDDVDDEDDADTKEEEEGIEDGGC